VPCVHVPCAVRECAAWACREKQSGCAFHAGGAAGPQRARAARHAAQSQPCYVINHAFVLPPTLLASRAAGAHSVWLVENRNLQPLRKPERSLQTPPHRETPVALSPLITTIAGTRAACQRSSGPCGAMCGCAHRVGRLNGRALDADLAGRLALLARLLYKRARGHLLGQDVRPARSPARCPRLASTAGGRADAPPAGASLAHPLAQRSTSLLTHGCKGRSARAMHVAAVLQASMVT
jgi:hypothetical protein